MTSAVRALALALAAALAFSLSAMRPPVPVRSDHPASTAASAVVWGGYPMIAATLPRQGAQPAVSNITAAGSLNWAGYAVSRYHLTFRSVRATFFVPYLNCAASPGKTLSAAWAGLDGFVGKPDSVEQGGIAANCSASGLASYYAWYELYPRPEVRAPIGLAAGDSVTVSVSYDAADKDFQITLTDNTRGTRYSVARKCPDVRVDKRLVTCPRNSAEVISEAPALSVDKHLVISALADYGAISFAGVAISDDAGVSGSILSPSWNATKIVQLKTSSGPTVARPTPTQAQSFDTYWLQEG
jgi:hypothetical protein